MNYITDINQLDLDKSYTYADYLMWRFQERVELFFGKIFKMSPAPNRRHQGISMNLSAAMYNFFKRHSCKVYSAPFDVRFTDKDGQITTVLQPDLCVICDKEKLDEQGCLGAPDLVVEILSPSNSKNEMKQKYQIYEQYGVREYWMVRPYEKSVQIYVLEEGKYRALPPLVEDDMITSVIFPEFSFFAGDVFEE